MIRKKIIIEYYCTRCNQEVDREDLKKCAVCHKEGCSCCIIKCGENNSHEHRVIGCQKLVCYRCSDWSPWGRVYPHLCKKCIDRNKVSYWYGQKAFNKFEKGELKDINPS